MWKFLIICVLFICNGNAEKIIIIGAGAAGIAAASRLLNQNITDFRILEAEDRIGGRIHSIHFGDAIVDLGAQYIHGEKGNAAYELAKDYVKPGKLFESTSIYYSGHMKTGDDLLNTYWMLKDELWKNGDPHVSFGDAFLDRYNATIWLKYKDDPTMLQYSRDFLRSCESMHLELEGAFSWLQPSAFSNFQDIEGDQMLSWEGLGYETIVDLLLKNYRNKTGYNIEHQISFGKTVDKLTRLKDSVVVRCKDGLEYITDHVIFTPSLGVLKHSHESLFEPRLRGDKVRAIENLGYDGGLKVILEFSNSWWGAKRNFILVWTDEQKKSLTNDIPFGPVKNGDHWLCWFWFIGQAPNNPNVLIGWFLGPMVPEIENLTTKEMKQGTTYALKKILGGEFDVSEPIRIEWSKWYSNPNFRGTYSYETVKWNNMNIFTDSSSLLEAITEKDQSIERCMDRNNRGTCSCGTQQPMNCNIPSARKILQEPITGKDGIPRILFAGEATHLKRPKTVDGAIETGFREADRLIKIWKK